MALDAASLAVFLSREPAAIVAELLVVRGSSPREAGTFMVIAPEALIGTIGGGALEHMVIRRARQALRDGLPPGTMDVPLGPEIGQCCGGRVEVAMRVVDAAEADRLTARLERADAGRRPVFIFGAGHVGRALALALAPLPFRVTVIDTRPETLQHLPEGVAGQAVAMPEAVVRRAPAGSVFAILTHDHALDFLIAREALARGDAAYVGMVGSRTKRARFASWFEGEGGTREQLAQLRLPIGSLGLRDKRPAVIAALAAAEILVHSASREAGLTGAQLPTGALVGAADEH
ncbi:molybdenum cofactor sulfurylase [Devosia enhydra]|uniref:Molybdenum cofactor sulfurylase n=1 Tax=Devosia enhydra TaxID=665118 RepID=A0A1K2HWK3_9HYPH|nr:xanthine dehydrogenase accessory protein XdhC [Devosia enhydra]SFZ83173.1 molybdenum cofactor sulfurylase [Devosia enhydra]